MISRGADHAVLSSSGGGAEAEVPKCYSGTSLWPLLGCRQFLLLRLSEASRELQVVPVLFENSFRKMKDVSDVSEPELGGGVKLKRPATNSEVALALRVIEGCYPLCKECADKAYRYDAIKVLLNILLTRGVLEQRACLDALVALLIKSAANEMNFKELQGVSKISELIMDMHRDTSVRIKCAENLSPFKLI